MNYLRSLSVGSLTTPDRIDDGRSKMHSGMEQSTLLDPSNVQTGWEDEEEMKEVSTQLASLKKKHDVVNKQVLKMEGNLDKVKKEIQALEMQEDQAEQAVYETSSRLQQLEEAITGTKGSLEEQAMGNAVYAHMQDRMKKDLIALSIKRKSLEAALRSKEQIYIEEVERNRITFGIKEDWLQSKNKLDELLKTIGDEQGDRKKRIQTLRKQI